MKKYLSFLLVVLTLLSVFCLTPVQASAAEFNIDFETSCTALYLENIDTETVVYQKNADMRRYPASTTKIMTYIVTAEHVKDMKKTNIKIKSSVLHQLDNTGSSLSGIMADETLSIYQLLHCLMIPSGNDAALILADYIGEGSTERFVQMMNDKAKELGCQNTHFANPHGLNDPNHYTTVHDMAIIAKYALTLPYFLEITDTTTSDIIGEDRYLVTTNWLIDAYRGGEKYYYPYAHGIKTGVTGNDSGYCLVSTATKGGYTYLCVAFGAPYEDENGEQYENGAMLDSIHLYDWAFDNLSIKTIIDKNDLVKGINLRFAWNKDTLQLSPAQSYATILPDEVAISSIDRVYHLPDSVDAPVKAGDVIGSVTLSYANTELCTIDLIASENVDRSELLTSIDGIKNVVTSKWFLLSMAVIAFLVVIYFIVVMIYKRKKKTQRPVKKYRKF